MRVQLRAWLQRDGRVRTANTNVANRALEKCSQHMDEHAGGDTRDK